MKFACPCGHAISDTTDFLPYKGYITPDESWEDWLDTFSSALRDLADYHATGAVTPWMTKMMNILGARASDHRELLSETMLQWSAKFSRPIYECTECGRLFVDPGSKSNQMLSYKPEDDTRGILRAEFPDVP
jgi:hypothetical protein